jgi:hypothetical protein
MGPGQRVDSESHRLSVGAVRLTPGRTTGLWQPGARRRLAHQQRPARGRQHGRRRTRLRFRRPWWGRLRHRVRHRHRLGGIGHRNGWRSGGGHPRRRFHDGVYRSAQHAPVGASAPRILAEPWSPGAIVTLFRDHLYALLTARFVMRTPQKPCRRTVGHTTARGFSAGGRSRRSGRSCDGNASSSRSRWWLDRHGPCRSGSYDVPANPGGT